MDIKQQNALIDDFLTIKLIDFSISSNYKYTKNTTIKIAYDCNKFLYVSCSSQ